MIFWHLPDFNFALKSKLFPYKQERTQRHLCFDKDDKCSQVNVTNPSAQTSTISTARSKMILISAIIKYKMRLTHEPNESQDRTSPTSAEEIFLKHFLKCCCMPIT